MTEWENKMEQKLVDNYTLRDDYFKSVVEIIKEEMIKYATWYGHETYMTGGNRGAAFLVINYYMENYEKIWDKENE